VRRDKGDLTQQYLQERFGPQGQPAPTVPKKLPKRPQPLKQHLRSTVTQIDPPKPLPPTPGQRKQDREDAAKVARQRRGRRVTAVQDIADRTTAAKDLSKKVKSDPTDAESVATLQQNLQEIMKQADNAPKTLKNEAKEVKRRAKDVQKAVVDAQKGRWGAKGRLERLGRELDAAGDKLTSYENTTEKRK
jgi:hypothetical protein